MTFQLPPLPYDYDALEPTIDKETMTLHHDKHHATYIAKLNDAVEQDASLQGKPIEELLAMASKVPAAVRNNGGGYWNHAFFWETMSPGGGAPSGRLAEAIDRDFGSLDALKEKFNAAGAGQFGSGWAWLLADDTGKLSVLATPNQDNPLMDVVQGNGTPILANDVWEHAYYITYRNDRAAYLKAWWDVVNWDKAAERYEAATA